MRPSSRWLAATLVFTLGLGGCGSPTTAQEWCVLHQDKVQKVGIEQGKQFDFAGARASIGWAEFVGDSDLERSIIISESTNGADIYEAACSTAFQRK